MESPCCEVAPLVREPLTAEAAAEPAGMLKALSDPVRLRLLSEIDGIVGPITWRRAIPASILP